VKRADFIRYWRRSKLKSPDKPTIFIKKNVRNHSYRQFYLVFAKIRFNQIRINRGLLHFSAFVKVSMAVVDLERIECGCKHLMLQFVTQNNQNEESFSITHFAYNHLQKHSTYYLM